MRLARALRISGVPRLAFAGAGGKTTALFRLARELPPPVLITSTTHFATWQLHLADQQYSLRGPQEVANLDVADLSGVIILTGKTAELERVSGLDMPTLDQVHSLAEAYQIPLLIEADGSRQLPLKAPGDYEPPIPPFVDTVVVVAGLSAFGKPLTSQWVHRPEQFQSISGLTPGEEITAEVIACVLTSRSGGLKNIPAGARRVVLLNQADTLELQAAGNSLSKNLLKEFHAVLIASLNSSGGSGKGSQPSRVIESGILAAHERIAGIVLAAGGSSRLGRPKQLLPWRGKPLVYTVAQTALSAGLSPVEIVTGSHGEEVEGALKELPVTFVHNPQWEAGQSTSVKAGLCALPEMVGGAVFLLSDQPQIPDTLIRSLVETHAQTLSPIVAPQIDRQRGNPILFDRDTFADFLALEGDAGGRRLFSRHQVTWVEWYGRDLLLDVDTPEDYQKLLKL
jgi:molybdenum cofactor cytidylyltransferase